MSKENGLPGLFPGDYDRPPANVVQLRGSGILPSHQLRQMIADGSIRGLPEIAEDQIQPASLDLRLGKRAYRVRASFLPGPDSTVMDRVRQLDGLPAIDLSAPGGAVFEKGAVYVAEVIESVHLTSGIEGRANPKSSTGRLDVLTRLITDRGVAFDRIGKGYKGPLYIEIAPLTFSIVVRQGCRLNQVRFHRGVAELPQNRLDEYYRAGQLTRVDGEPLPLWGSLVPVSVDLIGARGGPVGFRAKKNANKIDIDRVGQYPPEEFWEKIENANGALNLDPGDFYILGTREDVGVPPELAAEMIPYESTSGEFRVHYAGFFDPGFGWADGRATGSKAVLEVRSHGVPFTLEHGQIVGWLRYSQISVGRPDKLYGDDIRSNYQGQGVALAKQFRAWSA